MMPAEAYTSEDVLAWERRHLFAGTWTCLGRVEDLFPDERDQPARAGGRRHRLPACVRDGDALRMFANTCRHRGHELLPDGETASRRAISCPYHAWTYDLGGALKGAPGFRDVDGFEPPTTAWSSCRSPCGTAGCSGTRCTRSGSPEVPAFDAHLGDLAGILAPYDAGGLVLADRHTYEVAANWKVIAENYHECYHCPLDPPGAVHGLAAGLG